MTDPILATRDLHKDFDGPDGIVHAVSGIDLSIEPGEFVALQGPSGCGKSTLMLMAGGLLRPTRGTVSLAGTDLYTLSPNARAQFRANTIGFVFQQFHLIPYLDVISNVLVPDLALPGTNSRERAHELLDRFKLSHRLHHTPSALSIGEQQRVALARALLHSPALIFADEPTGNLDSGNRELILTHLSEYVSEGRAVLMVSHDDRAVEAASRVLHINEGKLT